MIALLALVSVSFDASLRNVLQVLVSFSDISSKISDREFSITDEVLFKLLFNHFHR